MEKGKRNQEDNEWILLSVQGSLFRLRTKLIASTDWILARMLSSDIPWEKTAEGQLYVDVDPASFRLIIYILSGVVVVDGEDIARLSRVDLLLLKATARYLMLDNIARSVEKIETSHSEVVEAMEQEIRMLKQRVEISERIDSILVDRPVFLYECGAYKTHRSNNRCGAKTLVIGSMLLNGTREYECSECSNDTSRIYGKNGRQFRNVFEASRGCDLDFAFGMLAK